MATKHKTDAQTLEDYRVALTNAVSQKEVSATLAEFGYNAQEIAKGTKLLAETTNAFNFNKQEDNETIAARAGFDNAKQAMENKYMLHRKKARVIFRNDDVTLKQLGLTGRVPKAYSAWIDKMKTFYDTASSDKAIQAKLQRLKITPNDIKNSIAEINTLNAKRADYLREVGESQDATKMKDAAFGKIDDWMSEFFAVAKIAMEDNPQLLESLGVLVRS